MRLRALLSLVLVLALATCATIEPQRDRAADTALPPVPLAYWPALEESAARDIMLPLNDGRSALNWRLRMLQAATNSIDLQTFIWEDDKVGTALVSEVLAAADRGVQVRVILDDSFLAHADGMLHALSEHTNIRYRIYNPLAVRYGGNALRELENLYDFDRINHRMHNKLLLVDGRVAIVGGRNQADQYFGLKEHHNFRDMEVILQGPFLGELSDVFDLYWNDPWTIPIEDLTAKDRDLDLAAERLALKENSLRVPSPVPATDAEWHALFAAGFEGQLKLIVDTPPDRSPAEDTPAQLAESLISRIDQTQSDLLLVSAYFIPTEPLTDALRRATERGVHVKVLTNSLGSNNHVTAHASYAHHRPELLRAGVELYELRADATDRANYIFSAAEESVLGLHAKFALFDECCLFAGSSNLDPRSLRINTEVGALIDSPALNHQIRQFFSVDLLPRNAWRVELTDDNNIIWLGEGGSVHKAPPASFFMRTESWFFGLLPIEEQM